MIATVQTQIRSELVGVLGLLAALLFAYKIIFVDYLITPDGMMGYDYSYFLPALLSGYYWFETNGLAYIPWFMPSQCGGLPFLGDVQIPYYSAPQILTLFLTPSKAVATTFLLFAAIGFMGTYGLVRFAFRTGPWMSATAAAIFMFNGFFAYRLLVGHLTFHAFMLTPLLAWTLLTVPRMNCGNRFWFRIGGHIGAGSLITGYMFHAGFGAIIVVPFLAIATVLVLHALFFGWQLRAWMIGALSGVGALTIAAIKLVPSISFVSRFPRGFYTLPGFDGPFDALQAALASLYFSLSSDAAEAELVNRVLWTGQNEWEYGVTVVPLLLLIFGIGIHIFNTRGFAAGRPGRISAFATLVVLGVIPLALNTHSDGWNEFLKGLPVIGQSSSHFRLFAIYILSAVIAPAVLMDRASSVLPKGALVRISVVAVGTVLAINAAQGKSNYAGIQIYDPSNIDLAYLEVQEGRSVPAITHIAAWADFQGQTVEWWHRYNMMTEGVSYLECYQPIFGYALETFPKNTLRSGSTSDVRDGVLNLKNPSCYVFPSENSCAPGDHFTIDQREEATNFSAYRPFDFNAAWYQVAAVWASILGTCVAFAALLAWAVVTIWTRRDLS